ncbi:MAG TPA: hypothetical protein PKY25_02580 [Bacilli bacterium]|nr:hypothetical protein [Bacilli bacterium]
MDKDFIDMNSIVGKIPFIGVNYSIKGLNNAFRSALKTWNVKYEEDKVSLLSFILREVEEMGCKIHAYDINFIKGSFRCRNEKGEELNVEVISGYHLDPSPKISVTKNGIKHVYECEAVKHAANNMFELYLYTNSIIYEKDDVVATREYNPYSFSYSIKKDDKFLSIYITPVNGSYDKFFCLPNEGQFLQDLYKIEPPINALKIYTMITERYSNKLIDKVRIKTPSNECLEAKVKGNILIEYSKSKTLESGSEVTSSYLLNNKEDKFSIVIKSDNLKAIVDDKQTQGLIDEEFKGIIKRFKK